MQEGKVPGTLRKIPTGHEGCAGQGCLWANTLIYRVRPSCSERYRVEKSRKCCLLPRLALCASAAPLWPHQVPAFAFACSHREVPARSCEGGKSLQAPPYLSSSKSRTLPT